MGCAGSSHGDEDWEAGFPLSFFEPSAASAMRDPSLRRRTVYRMQPFPMPCGFAERVCVSVNAKRELFLCDPDHPEARAVDLAFTFLRYEKREDGIVRDTWYEILPACDPHARIGRRKAHGVAALLSESQRASSDLRSAGLSYRFRLHHVHQAALPSHMRDATPHEVWCLKSTLDGEPLRFAFGFDLQQSSGLGPQYCTAAADAAAASSESGDGDDPSASPGSSLTADASNASPTTAAQQSMSIDSCAAQAAVPAREAFGSAAGGLQGVAVNTSALFSLHLERGQHAHDAQVAAKLRGLNLPLPPNNDSHARVRAAAEARSCFCNRALFEFLCRDDIRASKLLREASVRRSREWQTEKVADPRPAIQSALSRRLGSYMVAHVDGAAALAAGATTPLAQPAKSGGLPTLPRVSVMVSGGGWRALVGAVNFFEGLAYYTILPMVHSVAGISGGAWAIILILMAPPNMIQEEVFDGLVDPRMRIRSRDPPESLIKLMSKSYVHRTGVQLAASASSQRGTIGDRIARNLAGAVTFLVSTVGAKINASLTSSKELLDAIWFNPSRTWLFNFAELLHAQFIEPVVPLDEPTAASTADPGGSASSPLAGGSDREPAEVVEPVDPHSPRRERRRTEGLAAARCDGPRAPLAFAAVHSKTFREPADVRHYGHPHLWHVFDGLGGGGAQCIGNDRVPLDRIEVVHAVVETTAAAAAADDEAEGPDFKSVSAAAVGEPITPCSLMAMCGSAGAVCHEQLRAFDGEGFVGKLHVHDTPLREAKGSGRHYTHLQDAGIDCNLPFPVVTEGVGGVGPSDVVLVLDSSICARTPTELKKVMAKRYWRGAFSDTSRGMTEPFADGEVRVFFPAPGSGHPVLVYGFGETVSETAPTMKMHADEHMIHNCREQVFETARRMHQALEWVLSVDRLCVPPDGFQAFSDKQPAPPVSVPPTAATSTPSSPPGNESLTEEVNALMGRLLHMPAGGLSDLIIAPSPVAPPSVPVGTAVDTPTVSVEPPAASPINTDPDASESALCPLPDEGRNEPFSTTAATAVDSEPFA